MKFSKELMKGTAPFIILSVLQQFGKTYGYVLLKAIREESEEIFNFPDSTLYPILYRLEENGLIASSVESTPTGKERRYYSLTTEGETWLAGRKSELKIYVKGLQKFLNSPA